MKDPLACARGYQMLITVKLFAILRDRAGIAETTLDVAPNSTAASAAAMLGERYPAIRDFPRLAYAVNRAYVAGSTALADGDELALIPPVSGG